MCLLHPSLPSSIPLFSFPDVCRAPLVEAILPLHRGILGRRRSGPAKTTGVSQMGSQCSGLAPPLQQRRHLHAGQVGVPLGKKRVKQQKVTHRSRNEIYCRQWYFVLRCLKTDIQNVKETMESCLSLFLLTQYASWDLAFHMLPFAKVDPEFAKGQLVLFLREWYMAPNGQIPGT